jgi:hypothetical protein
MSALLSHNARGLLALLCCCCQQIAQMEQDVAAKRDQLEHLQAENARLKSRARVLETAERCSVEIHELMQLLNGLQVSLRFGAPLDCAQPVGANRGGVALPR